MGSYEEGMAELNVFEVFAAYHLGLFPDGTVKFGNVHDVARAFGVLPGDVTDLLQAEGLDSDTLLHSGFDLASAQADIQVSPPGVDLTHVAQMHYEMALEAKPKAPDWEADLEEDARVNAETYGDEPDR